MKKTLFAFILLLSFQKLFSQHCQFDEKFKHNSTFTTHFQTVEEVMAGQTQAPGHRSEPYLIPVVIHVIHRNGPENISDAQVLSQLEVLNTDFRKLNADTINTHSVFQSIAADMEIEFCLATKDPEGNPTNGIDRIYEPDTNLYFYQLIGLYGWDNDKYLNIYVTEKIGCFSSFPGEPDSVDGIFVTHGRFGTTGTAGSELYAEFARFGRTVTHEVGHYLGLYHTFSTLNDCDSNCATSGDYVCDTPPADMRWMVYSCLPQNTNTCFENPDLPDQVDNYMDYNIDSCSNMFSEGQKLRVMTTLTQIRQTLWSTENLVATGCAGFSGGEENPAVTVRVFPNPAEDFIHWEFTTLQSNSYIDVTDLAGRNISRINISGNITTMDVSHLPGGVYLYRIFSENTLLNQGKFIVCK